MKLSKITQTAIALFVASACSAAADQFAIRTEGPVAGATQKLLEALDIREIASVEINGVHFLVIDAKDEGFVEAYVYGHGIDAKGLYRLEADWTGAGLTSLPLEAREAFLEETICEFCTS